MCDCKLCILGDYYGYKKCCIKEFCDNYDNKNYKPTLDQEVSNLYISFYTWIPKLCIKCAKKFMDNKFKKISDIINLEKRNNNVGKIFPAPHDKKNIEEYFKREMTEKEIKDFQNTLGLKEKVIDININIKLINKTYK